MSNKHTAWVQMKNSNEKYIRKGRAWMTLPIPSAVKWQVSHYWILHKFSALFHVDQQGCYFPLFQYVKNPLQNKIPEAVLRARHTLQLSPIATRNTKPATIAGLPAANPQGLQAVCRAIGRISIPARKLQCCSQSQRGISYDPMTHSLSKWEVTDCPARVLLIWNGIARGPVQSCNVCREHCDLDCNLW